MNTRLDFNKFLSGGVKRRGLIFGLILLVGLFAFEIENYWTTWFALNDILGPVELSLGFVAFRWATLLGIAACAVDFAGLARIFTPEKGSREPAEVWYLFGAWVIAAAFDALLTWWSVSLAIESKPQSLVIVANGGSAGMIANAIPVGVAAFELLIRVLLINTFATAGENLFNEASSSPYRPSSQPSTRAPAQPAYRPAVPNSNPAYRPASKPAPTASQRPLYNEPTYHSVGLGDEPRTRS